MDKGKTVAQPPRNLPRGKACVTCRHRKVKCDSQRPVCARCIKAGTEDDCEYDERSASSKTQRLIEIVCGLEQKIRNIENTSAIDIRYIEPEISYFGCDILGSSDTGTPSSPDSERQAEISSDPQSSTSVDRMRMQDFAWDLVATFVPHIDQVLLVNTPVVATFLLNPSHAACFIPANRIHSSLENAIYLWGTFFSYNSAYEALSPLFLRQALESISFESQQSDPSKLLDVIQATTLVSMYFLVNNRMNEFSYHMSSSVSFVTSFGIDKLSFTTAGAGTAMGVPTTLDDLSSRVAIFWNVYVLDRMSAFILERPSTIIDNESPKTCITTPWPNASGTYIQNESQSSTIHTWLRNRPTSSISDSGILYRVQAITLLELASRFASNYKKSGSLEKTVAGMIHLDHFIVAFQALLPPVNSASLSSAASSLIITSHVCCFASTIQIHLVRAPRAMASAERCTLAARSLVSLFRLMQSNSYPWNLLDPIVNVCGHLAATALKHESVYLKSREIANRTRIQEIENDAQVLSLAIKLLGMCFPQIPLEAHQ